MSAMNQLKLQLIGQNLVPSFYLRYALERGLNRWKRRKVAAIPHLMKQKVVLSYAGASGARVFVETGTHYGFMLEACLQHFDRLISIEVEPHFHRRATRIFKKQPRVSVLRGDSAEFLPALLADIRCPCLFWLDAHFSGGLTGRARLNTPIRKELETILDHPYRHTILIDDANCFDGTDDYPHMKWIDEVARRGGYEISVADNIIRLLSF